MNREITVSKMKGETEKEYIAWLLYCEAGSIPRLMRAWEQLRENIGEVSGIWSGKVRILGRLPSERNIEKWSSRYQWVERKELKLKEDLKIIQEKSEKIKKEKLHKIADAFESISNKVLKRLREGEEPTIAEWKQVWEMLRTELGESIGKHEVTDSGIDESQQHPPEYREHMEPFDTLCNHIFENMLYEYASEKNHTVLIRFCWLFEEITGFFFHSGGRTKGIGHSREDSQAMLVREFEIAWEKFKNEIFDSENFIFEREESERQIQLSLRRLIGYPEGKKELNPLLRSPLKR